MPGRVKTRLTPPFSPAQAAALACAALTDTLAAAAGTAAARLVLALEGAPGGWLPDGVDVLAQRGGGLDERIAAAMADAYAGLPRPVVLIGMDTPQVTPALLAAALRPLTDGTADATFGPAPDGGFWLLGLRQPDSRLVLGVPMSTAGTGAAQLARLSAAGLRVRHLPALLDVDTAADAEAVARLAPRTRFAATLAAFRMPSPDLQPADLQPADLQSLDPHSPDLLSPDLQPADLQPADLQPADLQPADLQSLDPHSPDLLSPDLLSPNSLSPDPLSPGLGSAGRPSAVSSTRAAIRGSRDHDWTDSPPKTVTITRIVPPGAWRALPARLKTT